MALAALIGVGCGELWIAGGVAEAACNAVCQQKCRDSAHFGGLTVEQCIAKWSKLNEKPAEARRIEAQTKATRAGCWTYANCAAKCKSSYGSQGAAVVSNCIDTHPCSKYPKVC